MSRFTMIRVAGVFLILLHSPFAGAHEGPFTEPPSPPPLVEPLTAHGKLLGKPLTLKQESKTVDSQLGVQTQLETEFLGKTTRLMEASVEALPTPAGTDPQSPTAPGIPLAKTDLYIGGVRIWAGSLNFNQGSLTYTGGVAPTQIPLPLVMYPLGPLVLEVDAGIEFEGDVQAALTPGPSYPLTDSTLEAKLEAQLSAAGYLEGYASIWMVRGGVGGRVSLIDGSTGVNAHLFFDGRPPEGQALGKVVLLNGSVYGFVDTNLFFGHWTRILKKNFFHWNGLCYSFGAETCEVN